MQYRHGTGNPDVGTISTREHFYGIIYFWDKMQNAQFSKCWCENDFSVLKNRLFFTISSCDFENVKFGENLI
jgi:hypothetical protein